MVLPFQYTCWNVGMPAAQVDARLAAHVRQAHLGVEHARSDAMFGLPNESMIAMVTP